MLGDLPALVTANLVCRCFLARPGCGYKSGEEIGASLFLGTIHNIAIEVSDEPNGMFAKSFLAQVQMTLVRLPLHSFRSDFGRGGQRIEHGVQPVRRLFIEMSMAK